MREHTYDLEERHLTHTAACTEDDFVPWIEQPIPSSITHVELALQWLIQINSRPPHNPVTTTLPSLLQAEHFSYLSPTDELT